MLAQHSLQSYLGASPTGGVEQGINSTRNGFQESPNLCGCGHRSITLVRGGRIQNLWLKFASSRSGSKPLQFGLQLIRRPEHRSNLQDTEFERLGNPLDDRDAGFGAD